MKNKLIVITLFTLLVISCSKSNGASRKNYSCVTTYFVGGFTPTSEETIYATVAEKNAYEEKHSNNTKETICN